MFRKKFNFFNSYQNTKPLRFNIRNQLFRVNLSSSSTSTMTKHINWKQLMGSASMGCLSGIILSKITQSKNEELSKTQNRAPNILTYNDAYDYAINKWLMDPVTATMTLRHLKKVQLFAIENNHPEQIKRLTPYEDQAFFYIAHQALEKNLITVDEIFYLMKNKKPHEIDSALSDKVFHKLCFLNYSEFHLLKNEKERSTVTNFIFNCQFTSPYYIYQECLNYLMNDENKSLSDSVKILEKIDGKQLEQLRTRKYRQRIIDLLGLSPTVLTDNDNWFCTQDHVNALYKMIKTYKMPVKEALLELQSLTDNSYTDDIYKHHRVSTVAYSDATLGEAKKATRSQSSLFQWIKKSEFYFPSELIFKIDTSLDKDPSNHLNYLIILNYTLKLGYEAENCINQINKFSKYERNVFAEMIRKDDSFKTIIEKEFDFGPKLKNDKKSGYFCLSK